MYFPCLGDRRIDIHKYIHEQTRRYKLFVICFSSIPPAAVKSVFCVYISWSQLIHTKKYSVSHPSAARTIISIWPLNVKDLNKISYQRKFKCQWKCFHYSNLSFQIAFDSVHFFFSSSIDVTQPRQRDYKARIIRKPAIINIETSIYVDALMCARLMNRFDGDEPWTAVWVTIRFTEIIYNLQLQSLNKVYSRLSPNHSIRCWPQCKMLVAIVSMFFFCVVSLAQRHNRCFFCYLFFFF